MPTGAGAVAEGRRDDEQIINQVADGGNGRRCEIGEEEILRGRQGSIEDFKAYRSSIEIINDSSAVFRRSSS